MASNICTNSKCLAHFRLAPAPSSINFDSKVAGVEPLSLLPLGGGPPCAVASAGQKPRTARVSTAAGINRHQAVCPCSFCRDEDCVFIANLPLEKLPTPCPVSAEKIP